MALPDDYQEPKPKSARLLAAEAAVKLLQENAELIEHAEQLEMTFNFPIKGTPAKAYVTLTVKIGE